MIPERVRCLKILKFNSELAGTVSREEFLEAYEAYVEVCSRRQSFKCLSAERIADSGGFAFAAMKNLLGHPPRTWQPKLQTSE